MKIQNYLDRVVIINDQHAHMVFMKTDIGLNNCLHVLNLYFEGAEDQESKNAIACAMENLRAEHEAYDHAN